MPRMWVIWNKNPSDDMIVPGDMHIIRYGKKWLLIPCCYEIQEGNGEKINVTLFTFLFNRMRLMIQSGAFAIKNQPLNLLAQENPDTAIARLQESFKWFNDSANIPPSRNAQEQIAISQSIWQRWAAGTLMLPHHYPLAVRKFLQEIAATKTAS